MTNKYNAIQEINRQANLSQELKEQYINLVNAAEGPDYINAIEAEAVVANYALQNSNKKSKSNNNNAHPLARANSDPGRRKTHINTDELRAQGYSVGGNKTRKNRKQITYKYTKRNTKRLRKTRKNTKRPKYIKKHATQRRR
jgi:hypothetical protein